MRIEKLNELKEYIEELKVASCVEREVIGKGFLSTKTFDYTLNNGRIITREQILKGGKNGGASIIFPITKDKNVLVVIESRALTIEGVGVGFPAGYIEVGESPKNAAYREMLEETGYQPQKLDHLISFYQDQGCSKAFNHSFVATGCVKVSNQNLDSDELIRYMKFTFPEILELEEMGYFNDSNTLLTLEKVKNNAEKYF